MSVRKVLAICMMLTLCGPVVAQAQAQAEPGPATFQRTGIVDDIRDDALVINDMVFPVSSTVVVHAVNNSLTNLSVVQRGAQIGYAIGDDRAIVEIWLLPANYYDPALNRRNSVR